ncbi:MAG: hypothetical protein AAB646_02090 [Patescibacteria group bacterium]
MRESSLSSFFLVLGCILAIAFIFNFSYSGIPDTDSFYHIRHSWIYRTQNLFDSSFPWTQYSAIKHYGADIWYGFHILSIPLTYISNLVLSVKIGGFFVTVISLFLVFGALSRLQVSWPVFWVLIFYFSSADPMFRLTMLRPHAISLGLNMMIFAYLINVKGIPDRNNAIILFFLSAAFSWVHLSLAWMPILTAGTIGLVQFLKKQKIDWLHIMAVGFGLVVGWMMRPNPLGAAKLAYIQVAQLIVEKSRGVPLRFGRELTPFAWENFLDQLLPITIFLLIAAVVVFWLFSKKINVLDSVWSSMILTALFFYMTFGVARRSSEILAGFSIIFLSLVFTHYRNLAASSEARSFFTIVAAVILAYMPIKNIYRFETYTANAFHPEQFKEAALWLKENANPKEIVFNIHWDRFGQLFFWNYDNYYINGMDPIFQYAYNQSLYWKTHFLAIDSAPGYTCGKIRCTQEEVEDIYKVLKDDFNAKYIVVEKRRNPKLYKYFESANKFKKVFDAEEAVFRVL